MDRPQHLWGRDGVAVMTQSWALEVGGQGQVGSTGGLRLPAWLPVGALLSGGHCQGKQ